MSGERDRMIRFAVSAEGELVADPARRLGGRGIWIMAERAILDRLAAEPKLAARVARRAVRIARPPAAWAEEVLALHRAHCAGLAARIRQAGPLQGRLDRDSAALAGLAGPRDEAE